MEVRLGGRHKASRDMYISDITDVDSGPMVTALEVTEGRDKTIAVEPASTCMLAILFTSLRQKQTRVAKPCLRGN